MHATKQGPLAHLPMFAGTTSNHRRPRPCGEGLFAWKFEFEPDGPRSWTQPMTCASATSCRMTRIPGVLDVNGSSPQGRGRRLDTAIGVARVERSGTRGHRTAGTRTRVPLRSTQASVTGHCWSIPFSSSRRLGHASVRGRRTAATKMDMRGSVGPIYGSVLSCEATSWMAA